MAWDAEVPALFISDIQNNVVDILYVGSNNQPQIQVVAGGGQNDLSTSPQSVTSVAISHPGNLAVDGAGDSLYITSNAPGTPPDPLVLTIVSKFDLQAGQIQIWAGGGFNAGSGNPQPATSVSMGPAAIAADSSNNLYIASTNDTTPALNLVFRVDTSDNLTVIAGGGNSNTSYQPQPATSANVKPVGLTVDPLGDLYISDYVNQYLAEMPVSGSGSGSGTPDFTVTASPATQTVAAGSSASIQVDTSELNGDTATIALSCTVPATGCSFAPASVTPGKSSSLTVAASALAAGDNTITISATDGTNTHTTSATVAMTAAAGFTLTNSGNITVVQASSGTRTLTVTPSGSFTGQVNFSCSISGSPAGLTCSAPAANVNGSATVTSVLTVAATSSTPSGTYTATITASDTATNAIKSSTSISITVNASAGFTMGSGNNASMTLTPGGSGTATITFAPSGGFTGTVNLSCAVSTTMSNPTDPPTCSIPGSVTIGGNSGATAALTVNTTTVTTGMLAPVKGLAPFDGAALAIVVLFGIPSRRRNWLALLGLLAVIAIGGATGCGGGANGGGGSQGGGSQGTSAGNYTVTVTAAAGNVTATTSIQLTVN